MAAAPEIVKLPQRRSPARAALVAMRLRQWPKNLLVFAGLVFAARLNTATPKAGTGFELDVIAACFIGGASASGGVGKVLGAVIGAFVMGVMNNGMSILGIGIDYQQVIKGLVLLAAVFVDVYNRRKA